MSLTLFKQHSIGNDAVDQAIELIERGNFSPAERRQQYRNLIERAASNLVLAPSTQRKVSQLAETLSSQGQPATDQ